MDFTQITRFTKMQRRERPWITEDPLIDLSKKVLTLLEDQGYNTKFARERGPLERFHIVLLTHIMDTEFDTIDELVKKLVRCHGVQRMAREYIPLNPFQRKLSCHYYQALNEEKNLTIVFNALDILDNYVSIQGAIGNINGEVALRLNRLYALNLQPMSKIEVKNDQ